MKPVATIPELLGAALQRLTWLEPGGEAGGLPVAGFELDRGRLELFSAFTLRCDSGVPVTPESIVGCAITDAYADETGLVVVFAGRIYLRVSGITEGVADREAAAFQPLAGNRIGFR